MLAQDGFAPPPSGASLHHSPNKPFTPLTSLPPRVGTCSRTSASPFKQPQALDCCQNYSSLCARSAPASPPNKPGIARLRTRATQHAPLRTSQPKALDCGSPLPLSGASPLARHRSSSPHLRTSPRPRGAALAPLPLSQQAIQTSPFSLPPSPPGATAGLDQPNGHWLARFSPPCPLECSPLVHRCARNISAICLISPESIILAVPWWSLVDMTLNCSISTPSIFARIRTTT